MIYFDNAATTPVTKEVVEAMLPYFTENYGNPSSLYEHASGAKQAMEEARAKIGKCIGASGSEIYFTASGSEADNWAIKGMLDAGLKKGKNKIITSSVEHHAVLNTCEFLQERGADIIYLPVDAFGMVSPDDLERAIDDKCALVSIIYANNEIGTVEPVARLAEIAHSRGVPFHTDAVQAVGAVEIDVARLGADLLSMSAHKFHGPKGIGALYIKKGTRISNLIHGGMQERGKRAATENVPYIVGMAAALSAAVENIGENQKKITALRDRLIDGVMKNIPYVRLNGHPEKRLPGNANFSFQYIEGESLLLLLDINGFAASSGSACASGSLDPSHVLLATGLSHEIAHGSLRITLSADNTQEEVDSFLSVLPGIVQKLRDMSPLYEKIQKGV